jgi:RNA polymerase sigma-70 factor, ECF subfamily
MSPMDRHAEQSLIARAAAGDRAAAESLVKAHQGGLYSYILRLSGRTDIAEDVVQEAFIRALTHLDRFDSRFRFTTWLFTIARRVFLNICDRKSARTGLSDESWNECRGPELAGRACNSESGDTSHVRDALQAALMELPQDQREVVVLFHQQGWPIAIVAEHLNMPVGTVKSHLHRGRQRLRQTLLKNPAFLTGSIVPASWLAPSQSPEIGVRA